MFTIYTGANFAYSTPQQQIHGQVHGNKSLKRPQQYNNFLSSFEEIRSKDRLVVFDTAQRSTAKPDLLGKTGGSGWWHHKGVLWDCECYA